MDAKPGDVLIFGGPNLSGDQFATYLDQTQALVNDAGEFVCFVEVKVHAGDSVPIEKVKDWERFIERGVATLKSKKKAPADAGKED